AVTFANGMNNRVVIWKISLEVSKDTLERYCTCLSEDEKSRANRFRFEEDKRRFVVSRGVLRHLLGRQFSQPAQAVQFCYGKYGKPFVGQFGEAADKSQADCDFHFNLSHSGELALCVLGYQRVGVDIEKVKPIKRLEGMMARCLSDSELAEMKAEGTGDRSRSFLERWTCKEAYLKAIGLGLTQSMQAVEVQLVPPRLIHIPVDQASDWHLYRLALPDDYVGALVVAGEVTLQMCQWRHEEAFEGSPIRLLPNDNH
ncbi:MAG: 4'-phosphopantetheinyl transferase superfamily protein, partial [Phormidesmis sp.]